ncbi:MAG: glycosyltransferase family 39 protein [Anaerolineales bacterium]|nr:glycosyltransferase family 39 protein [Anaerolineales bacterium]
MALLALALRLAAVLTIPTQPVSDFWSLFTRAANLHDFGTYEAIPGRPDASFPPLYPILLSGSFAIPVDRLLTSKVLNAILGTASVLIIAELTFLFAGPKVGIVAALIQALYPRSVLMPVLIAAENLFIPLLLFWALLALRYILRDTSSTRSLVILGLVSGLLTLTRSVAYLLWIVIPLLTLLRGRPILTAAKELALLALFSNLVLVPWGYRNSRVLGQYTVLNSTGGVGLFIGNNPGSTGDFYPWQADIIQQDPGFFERTVIEQDSEARSLALRWIEENPGQAARLYLLKMYHLFSNEEFVKDFAISYGPVEPPWPAAPPLPLDHPIRQYGLTIAGALNSAFLTILALEVMGTALAIFLGRTRLSVNSRWAGAALLMFAIYFPALSAAFHSITRYRWPFTDLLVPFAAFAVVTLIGPLAMRATMRKTGS